MGLYFHHSGFNTAGHSERAASKSCTLSLIGLSRFNLRSFTVSAYVTSKRLEWIRDLDVRSFTAREFLRTAGMKLETT